MVIDMRPVVYLCGTITPNSVHLDWRKKAEEELAGYCIDVLNPTRGKDPTDWTLDGTDSAEDTPYACGGFVPRDRRDLRRADAVLLVFRTDSKVARQSVGTWCELGWATAWDIPVVVVTDLPEVAKHPFVWRQAAKVCGTLDEGLEYLEFLLL